MKPMGRSPEAGWVSSRWASARLLAPVPRTAVGARKTPDLTSRAPINEAEFRKLVGSDISALMNTINLESAEDLSELGEVRRSIVNFGLRDVARMSIDEDAVYGVAKELETALRGFEPRLVGGSIKIRRDEKVSPDEMRVRFLITADLRLQPANVPMEFVAELELDSGKIKIDRL